MFVSNLTVLNMIRYVQTGSVEIFFITYILRLLISWRIHPILTITVQQKVRMQRNMLATVVSTLVICSHDSCQPEDYGIGSKVGIYFSLSHP